MYLPESFIKRMAELNPRGKPSNPFAASFGFQNNFMNQQPAQAAPKQRATQRSARCAAGGGHAIGLQSRPIKRARSNAGFFWMRAAESAEADRHYFDFDPMIDQTGRPTRRRVAR